MNTQDFIIFGVALLILAIVVGKLLKMRRHDYPGQDD